MNLHEFQAKRLFADYGIPAPEGVLARSADQAAQAARDLGGQRWVLKAQVHAGGRGKAGGVKLVRTPEEARDAAAGMIGRKLTDRFVAEKAIGGRDIAHLTLVDVVAPPTPILAGVKMAALTVDLAASDGEGRAVIELRAVESMG